jgi:hypothetical protein
LYLYSLKFFSLGQIFDDRSAFDETLAHHEDQEGHEGLGYFGSKLRALPVLRGEI